MLEILLLAGPIVIVVVEGNIVQGHEAAEADLFVCLFY